MSKDVVPDCGGRLAAPEVVDEAHRRFEAPIQPLLQCHGEAVVIDDVTVRKDGHHDGLDQLASCRCGKNRREASSSW